MKKQSITTKALFIGLLAFSTNFGIAQDRALHLQETTVNGGNYVNLNSLSGLLTDIQNDFTIDFVFNRIRQSHQVSNGMILSINGAASSNPENSFLLGIQPDHRLTVNYGGGGVSSTSNNPLTFGCRTIAITSVNRQIRIYVDGQEWIELRGMMRTVNLNSRLSLGQEWDQSTSQHVEGIYDDFKVFDRAKSTSEIASDAVNPNNSIGQAGLKVYYDFDQGTPNGQNSGQTVLLNRSNLGSQYNGQLVNFTLNGNTSNFIFDECAPLVYCCEGNPNLLDNGNFESPISNDPVPSPVGFSSDYNDFGSMSLPGTYRVVNNATASSINPDWNIDDAFHCSNGRDDFENFLIVNGVTNQPIGTKAKIFGHSVTKTSIGEDYTFCMKIQELEACFNGLNTHPRIAIQVVGGVWVSGSGYEGEDVIVNTSTSSCDWQSISGKFTATSAVCFIEIYLYEDLKGDINDVALDNIAVQACTGNILFEDPVKAFSAGNSGFNNEMDLFSVYPNPFLNELTVKMERKGTTHFRLFDLQGKLILEGVESSTNFDLFLQNISGQTFILEVEQNGLKERSTIQKK